MTEHHSMVRSAIKSPGVEPDQFEEHTTTYLLSSRGQIVDVGGDWDRAAWENNGLEATADFVVGRQIADFLDGFETISFFNAISFNCWRYNTKFEMICRSDSPKRLQLFRMQFVPARDSLLEVRNDLLLSRPFPIANAMDARRRKVDAPRCSMCCSFRVGRHWVDPLAQTQTEFCVARHVICPDCKTRARQAMQRAHVPREQAFHIV